ncbi:MAG: hypothetical protein M1818_007812 [Claussenomyces sp. TS43310]|nr:MAG: hypothetical protein M1818_007812 [Claussenomyces sp. TS43310]
MHSSFAPLQFLPLGAIIQSIYVGETNIVQGFPKQSLYKSHNSPFFGETIGRVANRIKNGRIDSLNGKSYDLTANDAPNALHGGAVGWGKRIWDGPTPVGTKSIPGLDGGDLDGGESVQFQLRSEDGDEGYPGTVKATVTYTAATQKSSSGTQAIVLGIEYQVELIEGADETVVNMTNHSYFNLSAAPTIEGTEMSLGTNLYLPVDETGIPQGNVEPYMGLEADQKFVLGEEEPEVDNCFVFDKPSVPIDTRSEKLKSLVTAYHPKTGIHLEVLSTEPAFQFYLGKFIDVPAIDGVPARGKRSGFCVEPGRFVNAPNVDAWKNQVLLKKGQVYGSRIVYRAWSDKV